MNTLNDFCKFIVDQSDDDVIRIPAEYIENFEKYFEMNNEGKYVLKMVDVENVDGIRQVPILTLTWTVFCGLVEIYFDDEKH